MVRSPFWMSLVLVAVFVVTAAPNRRPHDHIGNFNFKVEIEGVTQGVIAGEIRAGTIEDTGDEHLVLYARKTHVVSPALDVAASLEPLFQAAVAAGHDQRAAQIAKVEYALETTPDRLAAFLVVDPPAGTTSTFCLDLEPVTDPVTLARTELHLLLCDRP